jgi:hypothetical protein
MALEVAALVARLTYLVEGTQDVVRSTEVITRAQKAIELSAEATSATSQKAAQDVVQSLRDMEKGMLRLAEVTKGTVLTFEDVAGGSRGVANAIEDQKRVLVALITEQENANSILTEAKTLAADVAAQYGEGSVAAKAAAAGVDELSTSFEKQNKVIGQNLERLKDLEKVQEKLGGEALGQLELENNVEKASGGLLRILER